MGSQAPTIRASRPGAERHLPPARGGTSGQGAILPSRPPLEIILRCCRCREVGPCDTDLICRRCGRVGLRPQHEPYDYDPRDLDGAVKVIEYGARGPVVHRDWQGRPMTNHAYALATTPKSYPLRGASGG